MMFLYFNSFLIISTYVLFHNLPLVIYECYSFLYQYKQIKIILQFFSKIAMLSAYPHKLILSLVEFSVVFLICSFFFVLQALKCQFILNKCLNVCTRLFFTSHGHPYIVVVSSLQNEILHLESLLILEFQGSHAIRDDIFLTPESRQLSAGHR